jgi:hypothetical protein
MKIGFMKHTYLILLALLALPAFAARPKPPATICIEDDKVVCTKPIVPGRAGVKWHPGHYMLTWSITKYSVSQLDEIANIPEVKGIQHRVYWNDIEPARDKYDFSIIEKLLAECRARNKRLVLQIEDRVFNSVNWEGRIPKYLQTDFNGVYVAQAANGTKRVLSTLWKPAVMDRYIKLHQKLAARFNDEPYFEGIATEEVTPGINPGSAGSGFDHRSQISDQWIRFMAAAREAWTQTNVFVYTNSLVGELDKIIDAAAKLGVGVGGPDLIPRQPMQGDKIIMGLLGGRDYRGVTPIGFAVQTPELCGKEGCNLPLDMYNYAVGQLGANYIFWVRHDASKGAAYSWKDGMLPLIRSKGVKTGCPSSLECAG